MQKMLAAMLRQAAAQIACENAGRKRHGIAHRKSPAKYLDVLRRP
jgi:hypothetical protein